MTSIFGIKPQKIKSLSGLVEALLTLSLTFMPLSPFSSDSINAAISESPQAQMPDPVQPQALSQPPQRTTPPKGMPKGFLAAMLAGNATDAGTTDLTLNKGRQEINPFLSSHPVSNNAGIMASGVGAALLLNHLAKSHPTLARVLGAGSLGLSGFDTLSNVLNAKTGKGFF
jgi:hypothetical protein